MAGQYYDPELLDSIMANLPEVRRRKRRASKLRKSEERLNKMADRDISLGSVSKTTDGGLYETQGTYIPNYSGMAEKAIGAIGGAYAGNQADEAEGEYDELRDEELLKTARTIGEQKRAEQNPVQAGLAQTMALPTPPPPPLDQAPPPAGAPPAGPPMPPVDIEQMFRGNLQMPQQPQVEPLTGGVPPEIQAASQEAKAQVAVEDLSNEDTTPTEEELRMYMALLDAPKIEGGLSGEGGDNYNISTRVDRDGNIWRIPKYGAPINTGIKSERKDKVLRGGDGRVWRLITSGEGSGTATEVQPPGLQRAPEGQVYEELTPEESSAWEAEESGQTQGGQRQGSPTGKMKIGQFEIDTGGASEEVMNNVAKQILAMEEYGVPREQMQPVVDAIQRKLLGGGPTGGLPPVTPSPVQVAPGGVPPATHPMATPPAQTAPLTPSDADVAGGVKGAQIDAETDRSVEIANLEGAKAAAQAEAKGDVELRQQAIADLPKMLDTRDRLKLDIPGLINHPGLSKIMGHKVWGRIGNGVPLESILRAVGVTPGTPEADVIARLDQMKGQVFLPAFQLLRGGGQITNVEGNKAENAMARMNWAQSVPEFQAAMREFFAAYEAGIAKRRDVAEGQYNMRNFNPGGSQNRSTPSARKPVSPEEEARRAAIRAKY